MQKGQVIGQLKTVFSKLCQVITASGIFARLILNLRYSHGGIGFLVPLHEQISGLLYGMSPNRIWSQFSDAVFRKIQRARGLRSGEKRRRGSLAEQMPWRVLGISRRTYFYRKKAGLLPEQVALEPYQIPADMAPRLGESTAIDG